MRVKKKIAILIGDGMADYPIQSLGGKTPLESAHTPAMDFMAQNGIMGLVKTVPDGMKPGSDTANLSIFGYDPEKYYSGRAPLEAINMGITLSDRDVALRCNLVQIDNDGIMIDFSADHIETDFTRIVVEELREKMDMISQSYTSGECLELFPGVSYRNILIWRNYPFTDIAETTPPHDIQGEPVDRYLPHGDGAELIIKVMERSKEIIGESDKINNGRKKFRGNPTSAWLWGGGWKPSMVPLGERFGLYGYTISAVDLIHGIGKAVGLSPIHVEGATGYLDTNYTGKADALIKALHDANFVFLHVESPDESGHEGNLKHKIKAIEDFDKKVVKRVLEGIQHFDDYTVLVMPDHPTPLSIRTHTSDPVPFCIYSNNENRSNSNKIAISGFNEAAAKKTGIMVNDGYRIIEIAINGRL